MRGHDPQSTSSSTSSIAPLAINEKWAPFASPAGEKNFSDIPAATIWDHKVYINNNMDYRIYCIDSQTGNVLWINNINEGFSNYNSASPMKGNSQPAVSNGVLVVGSNSERESLVALDAFTGNQIWAYSYDEGIMSYDPVISSPRILNNRVYINSNGWVRCFDLFGNGDGTTSILWERQVHKTLAPYEKFRTSASTIAITEDGARLVVAYGGVDRISDNISGVPHHEDYESGGLICLNPENGSVIWNIEKMEGGNNNFSPVIYNNRVYYVDASSTIQGISLWSVDLYYEQTHNRFYISEVAGEPALYQDKIFVRKVGGFLSYDIDLKVYDLNGELLWTYDRPWQLVSADPICADNKVIFPISDILSTANTSIICIDAGGAGQDNDILWEYGFNDEVPTKVSIANEEIYVVTGVSEGMLSAAEKLYILKSSVDDAAPTLTLTVPNNGGTYSGSIQIVAVAEDNNAVSYVEFQYSVDHVNWQVLPVGSQDDPQNNARDWFSNDGWGFDFSSATSDPAVGFAGIINSPNVWVRARAVDTSGNSSNWDECDQPFAVTNIVPGELNVILEPQEVINEGARWKLNTDTSWRESSQPLSINPGEYFVEFMDVVGWNKPGIMPITISPGLPSEIIATYVVIPKPTFYLTKNILENSCIVGNVAVSQNIYLHNSGEATLNYSVYEEVDWLSCNPTVGTSTHGQSRAINVTYSTASLPVGTYHATIRLTDPNATNSPQDVTVNLEVKPVPNTLDYIVIAGPGDMAENSNQDYDCRAYYSDGTDVPVQPQWSMNSEYASISPSGLVSAIEVPSDQTIGISASYTEGSITRTAEIQINISNTSPESPSISSLSTYLGGIETPVSIAGANFGSDQGRVTFNGIESAISAWTVTEIQTSVPLNATTGQVVVHTAVGQASNGVMFTVEPGRRLLEIQRSALIALYATTNGDTWTNNSGWKTAPLHSDGFAQPGTEGTWFGVAVDTEGRNVTDLNLPGNNLVGNIPDNIGDLAQLSTLILTSNHFRLMPARIGELANLELLYLDGKRTQRSDPPRIGRSDEPDHPLSLQQPAKWLDPGRTRGLVQSP